MPALTWVNQPQPRRSLRKPDFPDRLYEPERRRLPRLLAVRKGEVSAVCSPVRVPGLTPEACSSPQRGRAVLMAGCVDLPAQTLPGSEAPWNVRREQCRAPSQEQQPPAPGPRDLPPGNRSRAALRFWETGNDTPVVPAPPEGCECGDALARLRRLHFAGFSRTSRGNKRGG